MKLKRILHKALVGVGVMIVAVSILGAKEVLAVCNISSPSQKVFGNPPVTSYCQSFNDYDPQQRYWATDCGVAYVPDPPTGFWSGGQSVYSCGTGINPVTGNLQNYCYCHVEACNTGCGGGGEEPIVETCGDYSQPACQQGVCLNGKVCVGVGATACGCSSGKLCSDYVGDPQNLRATRLTSTSARIRWSAPSSYQYVSTQRLAIAKNRQDALNCSYNNLADPNNLCVVDVRDLPKTVGSFDTSSVLTPGYQYYVVLTIVAGDAPGAFSLCQTTDNIQYLSSCELTPDPTTVAVGANATMTTNLAQSLWSVAYSRSPASKATVTTPDATRLYQTTVHGVADGETTVTTSVTYSAGGAEMCSDTATVNVGCTSSAP